MHKSDFSIEKVKDILTRFGLGRIDKIEPLATSGNFNYAIKTAGKKYFLRLSLPAGPRHRSKEEILAEIELLEFLDSNGFPVILPVANKASEKIISLDGHNGYLREMTTAVELEKPNTDQINQFGRMLGRFHNLTKNYTGEFRREHTFNPERTLALFQEKKQVILDSDLNQKEKFADEFERAMRGLKFDDELPVGMLHEDLGRRHVLWADGKIVALIDFDRAYIGKLIWDVGQALRGWCWVDVDRKNLSECREKQREFLAGYESVRPLTAGEKNRLIDAIKFAFLERALSFCLRSIKVTHDADDADFARESLLVAVPIIEREKKNAL